MDVLKQSAQLRAELFHVGKIGRESESARERAQLKLGEVLSI